MNFTQIYSLCRMVCIRKIKGLFLFVELEIAKKRGCLKMHLGVSLSGVEGHFQ